MFAKTRFEKYSTKLLFLGKISRHGIHFLQARRQGSNSYLVSKWLFFWLATLKQYHSFSIQQPFLSTFFFTQHISKKKFIINNNEDTSKWQMRTQRWLAIAKTESISFYILTSLRYDWKKRNQTEKNEVRIIIDFFFNNQIYKVLNATPQ